MPIPATLGHKCTHTTERRGMKRRHTHAARAAWSKERHILAPLADKFVRSLAKTALYKNPPTLSA